MIHSESTSRDVVVARDVCRAARRQGAGVLPRPATVTPGDAGAENAPRRAFQKPPHAQPPRSSGSARAHQRRRP